MNLLSFSHTLELLPTLKSLLSLSLVLTNTEKKSSHARIIEIEEINQEQNLNLNSKVCAHNKNWSRKFEYTENHRTKKHKEKTRTNQIFNILNSNSFYFHFIIFFTGTYIIALYVCVLVLLLLLPENTTHSRFNLHSFNR